MKSLITFIRLNWAAKQLFTYTFFLLIIIRFGLRFLNFAQLQRFTDRLGRLYPDQPTQYTLTGIIWAVNLSSKFTPGGAKCLARALTTKILMQQQHYIGEICIGVAKGDRGNLEAHAWVEVEGNVIMGWLPDLARYKPLEKGAYRAFSKFA
jgi:Transglutaminase-like superfamily